ncbi:MAG: hypothetical protein E7Z87_07700 [Cyanobacteria bacterium SIG26]|nr:hypothetical protein [Cyanobacteria bacterium SIG26]
MPEINVCLFDLYYLFKLFPFWENDLDQDIEDYETKTQEDMAQIRVNLFSEFGYEKDKAFI